LGEAWFSILVMVAEDLCFRICWWWCLWVVVLLQRMIGCGSVGFWLPVVAR
ncbi:hypothetical protein ISN44_As08g027910, partial [Arabidopsis suecica]